MTLVIALVAALAARAQVDPNANCPNATEKAAQCCYDYTEVKGGLRAL